MAVTRLHALGAIVVAGGALFFVLGTQADEAESCGILSVLDLASALGRDVPPSAAKEIRAAYPQAAVSMLDVRQAAAMIGLPLEGVACSFQELMTQVPGPKIAHLRDPDHFLVVVQASDEWVQTVDRGVVVIVPRSELEARYSGRALTVVTPTAGEAAGPKLELPEFHYTFGMAGLGQHVSHAFGVRNLGDHDLVLRVKEPEG